MPSKHVFWRSEYRVGSWYEKVLACCPGECAACFFSPVVFVISQGVRYVLLDPTWFGETSRGDGSVASVTRVAHVRIRHGVLFARQHWAGADRWSWPKRRVRPLIRDHAELFQSVCWTGNRLKQRCVAGFGIRAKKCDTGPATGIGHEKRVSAYAIDRRP